MSFRDFSEVQYVKTMDTSEEIRIGTFQAAENFELKYMRLTLVMEGLSSIAGQIGVKIYSDPGYSSLLYESSYSDLADITISDTGKAQWIGWIRIDFDRENINKELVYYPTIISPDYVRVIGTFYIGFCYDFPYPIYDNEEDLFYNHPLQMQVFGYHNRS